MLLINCIFGIFPLLFCFVTCKVIIFNKSFCSSIFFSPFSCKKIRSSNQKPTSHPSGLGALGWTKAGMFFESCKLTSTNYIMSNIYSNIRNVHFTHILLGPHDFYCFKCCFRRKSLG